MDINVQTPTVLSLSKGNRKKKVVGEDVVTENDGMDMFMQAGVAAK